MATQSGGLFKKFSLENVSENAATQQREQKRVRNEIEDQYQHCQALLEEIIPKKADITLVRCHDGIMLVVTAAPPQHVLFFQSHGGPWIPHLRILHKYPKLLPRHQCDIGGCRHVLNGATVMVPGLKHATGGAIAPAVEKGNAVALGIEGKQHACAVGVALMSSDEMAQESKGEAMDNMHYIGDGLWQTWNLAGEEDPDAIEWKKSRQDATKKDVEPAPVNDDDTDEE